MHSFLLNGQEWQYVVGSTDVVIIPPYHEGEPFAVGQNIIAGCSWTELEKRRYLNPTEEQITPSLVREFIERRSSNDAI